MDGTERLQLTSPPMEVLWAQWSPDGTQIAFGGALPGKPSRVYIVSAEGGMPEEVTHGERNELMPNWSLDGNSLFFGNMPAGAIYHLDLKSHQLTTVSGSEGMWFPRLSPDNDHIAALTNTSHLMLFDVKTQKWTELTHTAAYYPAWSHDGKYVYFSSAAEGEPVFNRVHIKDHRLERVTILKEVKRATHGGPGSWTSLALDGSPLALRDISTYEIYALDWQLL